MSGPIDAYPDFVAAVHERLRQGEREYGDGSFSAPVDKLAGELIEEVLDISGWAFVVWTRLEEFKRRLGEIEARLGEMEIMIGDGAEEEGER